jgi:hypothetical protein
MNPETNKFELLRPDTDQDEDPGPEDIGRLQRMVQRLKEQDKNGPRPTTTLLRPNGEPVPQHWTQFQIGECVVIKNYTFKVAYIGETAILFEPVGIPDLGEQR